MPMQKKHRRKWRDPPLAEPHVGLARQLFRADGVAVAAGEEPLAEEHLRGGVAGMDGRHYAAAVRG